MFNVAVVGSGYIAQNHFAAIRAVEDARLVAVVARDAQKGERVARENGARFYQSLEEAKCLENINAVIICTPTDLHERYVLEAARLGCHVLCEKPITFSLESFDRMAAACKAANVYFMVAQVVRWWPEYALIKRMIDEGKLGKIHMIYEKRLAQHPNWADWHRDPARSGGGLYDLNVHDIDYLLYVLGKPESLYCGGWQSETGCWNHICTHLNWKNGAKAVVEASLEMTGDWPFSVEVRASGDLGTLHYTHTAGFNLNDAAQVNDELRFYPVDGEMRVMEVEQRDMFEDQAREFFAAIREKRASLVTLEENRAVLEILRASVRSLENNTVEKL